VLLQLHHGRNSAGDRRLLKGGDYGTPILKGCVKDRQERDGTAQSGKGGKGGTVKSRKQAIAIGLSEARKKGKKVPKKKTATKKYTWFTS
jgi:hypothetical protein